MDYMKIKAEGKVEIEDELGRTVFIGNQQSGGLVITIEELEALSKIEASNEGYENEIAGLESDLEEAERENENLALQIKELKEINEELGDKIKFWIRVADHLSEICKPKPANKTTKMKKKVK